MYIIYILHCLIFVCLQQSNLQMYISLLIIAFASFVICEKLYDKANDKEDSGIEAGIFGVKRNPWINRNGSDYLYQFNTGETSWIFAREYCRQQGSDLAWFESREEAEWIVSKTVVLRAPGANNKYILINLARDPVDQIWKWNNNETYDGLTIPWLQTNPKPAQNCAAYYVRENAISDVSCDFRQLPIHYTRFVCKISIEDMQKYGLSYQIDNVFQLLKNWENIHLCERHWSYYNGSCYRVIKGLRKSWVESELYCGTRFGLDSHLATIVSKLSQIYLYKLYVTKHGSLPFFGAWVGANDLEEEGVWKWWDNSPVKFNITWDKGYYGVIQPDDDSHTQNCLAYAPNGGMHDLWCTHKAGFICQKPSHLYLY